MKIHHPSQYNKCNPPPPTLPKGKVSRKEQTPLCSEDRDFTC